MRTQIPPLLLFVFSTACYQYVPIDDTAPLPEMGRGVRVRLNEPQSLELGSVTVHDISVLEGEVFQNDGDTMSLYSRMIQHTNGAVFYFERSDLNRVEQRQLIPWKTGVAVGLGVAAIAVTAVFVFDLGGGDERNGGEGDNTFRRGFSIPFYFVFP